MNWHRCHKFCLDMCSREMVACPETHTYRVESDQRVKSLCFMLTIEINSTAIVVMIFRLHSLGYKSCIWTEILLRQVHSNILRPYFNVRTNQLWYQLREIINLITCYFLFHDHLSLTTKPSNDVYEGRCVLLRDVSMIIILFTLALSDFLISYWNWYSHA